MGDPVKHRVGEGEVELQMLKEELNDDRGVKVMGEGVELTLTDLVREEV